MPWSPGNAPTPQETLEIECTPHLLLHNKLPPNFQWLKAMSFFCLFVCLFATNISDLIYSVSQESRSSSAWWLWLRVPQKAAIKVSPCCSQLKREAAPNSHTQVSPELLHPVLPVGELALCLPWYPGASPLMYKMERMDGRLWHKLSTY